MNIPHSIRLLVIYVLTISSIAFAGVSIAIPRARAAMAPSPTSCILAQTPTACWVPAGPMVDKIQIQVYSSAMNECVAILASSPPTVDLTDTLLPLGMGGCPNAGSTVYVTASNFVYLIPWTGVIDASPSFLGLGASSTAGIPNYFTLLNGWNKGPTIPGTIRQGLQSGTVNLNPYLASTSHELYVLGEIYDTLLQSNPYQPSVKYGWMANDFSITPTTVHVDLRSNLFFPDGPGTPPSGIKVTANDVRFSFLSLESNAVPGFLHSCLSTSSVGDVTIANDFSLTINVGGAGANAALSCLGSTPIIPQHIWSVCAQSPSTAGCAGPASNNGVTKCGANDLATTPQCALRTDFATIDPVISNQLIGSGPFECVNLSTGQVGGGCTSSGSQAVGAGGTIILQRYGLGFAGTDLFHSYFRDSAKYKLWQWADKFNEGTFDATDLLDAVECFSQPALSTSVSGNPAEPCAHWAYQAAAVTCTPSAGTCNGNSIPPGGTVATGGSCIGPDNCANPIPAGTTVTAAEVIQAAGQFGISWTAAATPIAYNTLASTQPVPQTLYEGGITYGP